MSRADKLEIPGLIDSLRLGDKITIERANHASPNTTHTFLKADHMFVYTSPTEKSTPTNMPKMWFRYSVLNKVPSKTVKLYTELS